MSEPKIPAHAELRFVKGIGPARAGHLARSGVVTVEDLLYALPFRYEDRRRFTSVAELRGMMREGTASVTVAEASHRYVKRRFHISRIELADDSGSIPAVWFNQPWLRDVLKPGRRLAIFGRAVRSKQGKIQLEHPDFELLDDEDGADEGIHTGRIVPVYRKLADMSSRVQRRVIFHLLRRLDADSLPAIVPPQIARRHGLASRVEALRGIHFPEDGSEAVLAEKRTAAHRALAFEEIFLLQLALAQRREGHRSRGRGISYRVTDALRTNLRKLLPFRLTGAQKRVLKEIGQDLKAPYPMNRLLQGDVGSGKTVVALLALLVAVENGYQAALMAPTEILAEQHFRTIRGMLQDGPVDARCVLLTGSLRAPTRRQVLGEIANGMAQLVVGTHALFEAGVDFHKLGMVVVDEQHRFGVLQRVALAEKGHRPDLLVMTATPIPRSLALTMYGDLDLSVIDELPPGRKPIKTVVRRESERNRVYSGLRSELVKGRQAYVVVPLVEETERSDLKAAETFHAHLRDVVIPDFNVGMVHGRMKPADKDAVMQGFVAGDVDVLVATTVIEVGVDVPNATVMVVEHAERFGLSQLHQLRGRVGRGSERSYCVLMNGAEEQGQNARRRLAIMEQTSDGFKIADEDLAIRGPGMIFGTQQHGLSDLQFLAVVLRDPELLESARTEAQRLVARPAGRAEAERLLGSLGPRWQRRLALAEVG